MKYFIATIFLSILSSADAQSDGFETWDTDYPEVDILEILKYEQYYADSIESDKKIPQYYSRMDKYSFEVTYTGAKRKLDDDVLQSMKNVFKLFLGNPDQLNSLVANEYGFLLGPNEVWIPIQKVLEKPLRKEIKKGDKLKIYCLFLNEHNSTNGLLNTFLISEFRKR